VPARHLDRPFLLGSTLATVCTGLETFGRPMDRAEAGDNAAMLLRGVRRLDSGR
jgi:elongation factor Tu